MKRITGFLKYANDWRVMLLFVFVAVALAYLLLKPIQSFILPTLLYYLWWGKIIYATLPQVLWWFIFLLILMLIAARNLIKLPKPTHKSNQAERVWESRLIYWSEVIKYSRKGGYFKWYLANELGQLTINVLAEQEKLSKSQIREYIISNKFNIPSDIHTYLQTGLDAQQSFQLTTSRLPFLSKEEPSDLDLDVEEVIKLLENKLDIDNSNTTIEANHGI
jgi:hypothetical protein